MMTSTKPSRAIEFSGDIEAWATTLGMPVAEFRASIGALIERGHLERIGTGTTWPDVCETGAVPAHRTVSSDATLRHFSRSA